MQRKYTPGPWRVDATYDPDGICILAGEARYICGAVDNDPDRTAIELDASHGMSPQDVFAMQVENAANACLLAAAPDLDEALREAEWGACTPSDERQCPVCFNTKDEGHEADCKLAAALAKVSATATSPQDKA